MNLDFYFSPIVSWPIIIGFSGVALSLLIFQIYSKDSGWVARMIAILILILGALGPSITTENRSPLSDISLIVVDKTKSQSVDKRSYRRDSALSEILKLGGGFPSLEFKVVEIDNINSNRSNLFTVLNDNIKKIPLERFAGAIVLTDGRAHDVKKIDDLPGPLHILLTGKRQEYDRRLVILKSPSYAVIGNSATIEYVVEDERISGKKNAELFPIATNIFIDGKLKIRNLVIAGETNSFEFKPDHAGQNIIEIRAETSIDEISDVNNQAVLNINGVRDRLKVLLISGQPYAGERTWRNLMKSDPSVDLIHFTILRPPEKDDFTPLNELALISFPVHELFEEKIDDFDLIIFDRYVVRDVLPPSYINNINKKVRDGGAVLLIVGPEFTSVRSLASTPLSAILPVKPDNKVLEGEFKPQITETGKKHPITSSLGQGENKTNWGRWFRQIPFSEYTGNVLMSGASEKPLLIVKRVDKGRVGLLASDHIWLWAKNFDNGGPHGQLIKRLSHWLMREPDLEEESLKGRLERNKLIIERRSLSDKPVSLIIRAPSGLKNEIELTPNPNGVSKFEIKSPELGVYKISDGILDSLVHAGDLNRVEMSDLKSGPELFSYLIQKSGGSSQWLIDEKLNLRRVKPGMHASGNGWIGLVKNNAYLTSGILEKSIFTGLFLILILSIALGFSWRREGK